MTASWMLFLCGLTVGAALTFLAATLTSPTDHHASSESWTVAAIAARLECERGAANSDTSRVRGRHGSADSGPPETPPLPASN